MKNRKYSQLAIALVVVMTISSCRDLFEVKDIQTNPNASSTASINTLFAGTLVGLATIHEDTDCRIAFMWSGQLAGESRQHLAFAQYQVSSATFGWANLYSVLTNARLIQEKATPLNNKTALGIAQVIEAMTIERLTDFWGDVPYSQAINPDKYATPVYDKQADVYTALITLLDKAYENLDAGLGAVAAEKEFIFKGDADSWKHAAKTIQARLYLHQGNYAAAIASANLGVIDPSGDALVPHGVSQTIDLNMNFDFFENTRPGDTGFASPAFMSDFMKSPPNKVGNYRRNTKTNEAALFNHFFQTGIYTDGLDPNTADGMFTNNGPHPLVTFYENQLILAESYARLGSPNIPAAVGALNTVRGSLKGGYVNGKTILSKYQALGLQYDDYLDVDFVPGGIANPVSTGRNQQSSLLYEIATAKYFLLIAQYESFNEVRRLQKAVPVVQLGILPTTGTQLPSRYIYPQNQINTNPNVPKVSSGGVADIFQKLPIFQ